MKYVFFSCRRFLFYVDVIDVNVANAYVGDRENSLRLKEAELKELRTRVDKVRAVGSIGDWFAVHARLVEARAKPLKKNYYYYVFFGGLLFASRPRTCKHFTIHTKYVFKICSIYINRDLDACDAGWLLAYVIPGRAFVDGLSFISATVSTKALKFSIKARLKITSNKVAEKPKDTTSLPLHFL